MLTLKKSVLSLAVRRFCNTRSFLTDSYKCNEVWQERLSCPLLMKVEHEVLYYKLSSMLANDTKQISAIDLDIFANSLTDKIFLDELEDLTHKFRLSAQAGTLLPSTHHAVVRFYLESGNKSDLVRILRDRLNYGIFTDYYLSNLLMDTFLKENDFQNSVVIVSNQMLQEELNNEITKTMGSYSCLKYVTDSINEKEIPVDVQEKNNEKEEEEDDEEEEVKRVRVDFLRNPYFDDHFDLTDNDHLAGKTLLAISKTNNTILGNSLKAIGLAYYNKWNELGSLLDKSESPVYLETVDLAVAAIDKRAPENSEKLKNALTKLKVENKSLTEETKNALMEAINKNEEKEIQIQKQVCKTSLRIKLNFFINKKFDF